MNEEVQALATHTNPRPGFWKTFGLFMLWFIMPMTAFMEMTKQFSRNDDPNKR
jgi:hypothetical protein